MTAFSIFLCSWFWNFLSISIGEEALHYYETKGKMDRRRAPESPGSFKAVWSWLA
jgi:hypothetical protein